MKSVANVGFWQPIKEGDRRSLVLWFAVAILMTLAVYAGAPSVFVSRFATGWPHDDRLDWYKYVYHHSAVLVLFGLIPVAIIKLLFKESLRDYGFRVGDWRAGLRAILIAGSILTVITIVTSPDQQMLREYPLTMRAMKSVGWFVAWGGVYLVYYAGWEMFFRGFMGFGLEKNLGTFHALMAQVACSTIIHIGKPFPETFAAIGGGLIMGLMAFRTRSLLWPLLFHWYLGMLNTYICGIYK
jgi:membrane protease YdiL (CAAX protease family)